MLVLITLFKDDDAHLTHVCVCVCVCMYVHVASIVTYLSAAVNQSTLFSPYCKIIRFCHEKRIRGRERRGGEGGGKMRTVAPTNW